jgi:uncharacterized protein (TIGR02001 family)
MGIEMKRLIIAVLLVSTVYSEFAAAEDISGNVALATDYRFRGISQTGRNPAIQGGFDYSHESGLYVGTWASNVSFTEGGTEIDVYGGWAKDLSDSVSIDLGVLYYGYPSENKDAGYWEIYGSVGFFGATVGLNYSPEYTYETGKYFYLYGDYSLPLGDSGVSLDAHIALNQFDSDQDLANFGIGSGSDNYVDYSIGATAPFVGLDWTLAWVGTDIKESECFGGSKDCKGNVVLSVSKSL